jgi:D-tyrosyl-tRNA(Tyr) deacylase
MKIVIQRVSEAALRIDGRITAAIGPGLVLLVGIGHNDRKDDLEWYAKKCAQLRIFPDDEGRMNKSVLDTGGTILAVSQFTLYGDARRGNRPGFTGAASPETAEPLYDEFVRLLRSFGLEVQTGVFGAMMDVEIHNNGPVTIIIDNK